MCYWPVLFEIGPPQAYFAHWQLLSAQSGEAGLSSADTSVAVETY